MELSMKFEGEAFRRAMIYWDMYSRFPNSPYAQHNLQMYEVWREKAIERQIQEDATRDRVMAHIESRRELMESLLLEKKR